MIARGLNGFSKALGGTQNAWVGGGEGLYGEACEREDRRGFRVSSQVG